MAAQERTEIRRQQVALAEHLRDEHGMSNQEIAEAMELKESTIRNLLKLNG